MAMLKFFKKGTDQELGTYLLSVWLKDDSLEVDGKSGVNSVFVIDVTSMNPKIPKDTFEVYKP